MKIKAFIGFLMVIFCASANAQQSRQNSYSGDDIATSEKMAFLRNQSKKERGQLTGASENFDVNYYRCEWEIDPAVNYIRGKLSSYFHITSNSTEITYDLSAVLTVDSVLYHGTKISFTRPQNLVTIQFPSSLNAGTLDSVSIFYQGAPVGGGFGSFIQTDHGGTPVIWTLSEPYGASDWWPSKNGLGDKADSLDVIITCPDIYRASSNGVELPSVFAGGNRICIFKHRYPIASYLVALAVTNFSLETKSVLLGTTNMPILDYIYPEDSAYFSGRLVFMLNAMQLYHNTYGDYPFLKEKYGQTQFQWGGGMEHQTNSFIINGSEELMAHELSHQWFGDKITCGSWQDLWLNEGFATYSQVLYLEKLSPGFLNISLRNKLANITALPDGSVWVNDTTNISRLFDNRLTYNKGSYVIRMLRWKLGDSLFYKAIQEYQQDPTLKFGYARTADLKRHMESVSGLDLTEFFQSWYYGEGYPSYQLEWTGLGGGLVSTKLKQTTSHPSVSFYAMPVALRFSNSSQQKTVVIDHKSSGQVNFLDLGFEPDTVEIDPDLWLLSANNTISHAIINLPDQVNVLPNPVSDQFYIFLKALSGDKATLQLYSMSGQLLMNRNVALTNGNGFVGMSSQFLPRGQYILRVLAGGQKITKKIIK